MKEEKTRPKRTKREAKGKLAEAEKQKTTAKPRNQKRSSIPPGERLTARVTDEDIACLAYALWEDRGRPLGSPDEDWHKAKEQLNTGPE